MQERSAAVLLFRNSCSSSNCNVSLHTVATLSRNKACSISSRPHLYLHFRPRRCPPVQQRKCALGGMVFPRRSKPRRLRQLRRSSLACSCLQRGEEALCSVQQQRARINCELSPWLKDIAALLPQTTAGGRSSSLDASALGMHRLVEKLYSKLNECDKLRERRLRFNDRRLMGFEPELVGALRIFTAMPLKLLADAPYLLTLGVGGRIHALEVESCTISVVLTHLFLLSILPAPPSVLDASRFRYCCRIPTPGST